MDDVDFDLRRVGSIAVAVAFVVVLGSLLVTSVPQIVGADQSYVVLSDSMSPSIDAGAVVFVAGVQPERIDTGDVITYLDKSGDQTIRVTHRVVDIESTDTGRQFVTKGDANDQPDARSVAPSQIVGTVQFHTPLIGYLIAFVNSTLGLVTIVILPAVVLGISEFWSVYTTVTDRGEQSR